MSLVAKPVPSVLRRVVFRSCGREYLGALLGNKVCSLVVQMFMVLNFESVVGCVDGFTRCHVGMFLVCCSASFRGTPPHACMGGNCLVVYVFLLLGGCLG